MSSGCTLEPGRYRRVLREPWSEGLQISGTEMSPHFKFEGSKMFQKVWMVGHGAYSNNTSCSLQAPLPYICLIRHLMKNALHLPGCVCATLIHSQVDVLRGKEAGVSTQQSKAYNHNIKQVLFP